MENLRKIMVATPSLSGVVTSWFLDSMVRSIKLCAASGIDVCPVVLINESILPMARNELFEVAYQADVESMVFIDSDQAWEPSALLEIINSHYDVLGLPVVSKTDEPDQFNVKISDVKNIKYSPEGYVKVDGVGTGFLKISKKVIHSLWVNNISLNFRGRPLKLICEYSSIGDEFVGEDICLSGKIKDLGYDIWVNPKSTCAHVGDKVWFGDFSKFLTSLHP